jgi:hypothetical protein
MNDDKQEFNFSLDILRDIRELRQKYLTPINKLHKDQLTQLEHEVERFHSISASYTEPDLRVKMIKENIEGKKLAIKLINNRLEIGKIVVPKIKEGEALVHGRIIDENGHGIKNLTISLIVGDERLDILGKSDASGYYSIILPVALVNNINQQNQQDAITVYVHYLNVLVHKSPETLKLTGKETKYEVVIDTVEINAINQQAKEKKENIKDDDLATFSSI